jgi:hypothetical protein
MYHLAQKLTPPKVPRGPIFLQLKEDNIRKGFLETMRIADCLTLARDGGEVTMTETICRLIGTLLTGKNADDLVFTRKMELLHGVFGRPGALLAFGLESENGLQRLCASSNWQKMRSVRFKAPRVSRADLS